MKNIIAGIILVLLIVFLLMNIKIRNDEIWRLRVENQDLREQIMILKGSNGNEQ